MSRTPGSLYQKERSMRGFSKWFGLAAVGVSLTGCVSQSEFKKVEAERNLLREQVQTVRAEAEEYRNQLGAVSEQANAKDEQITQLSSQKTELQAQLDEINQQYAEALERVNNPLPAALTSELTDFASRNGDVLSFDSEKGIIKFKSDVSFAPGSVELTPKALEAVTKLSKILNDKGVADYELMIAGHTDAIQVNRAETIKAGHRDNWYLSAHRAIAVGKAMQKNAISAYRLAMVGYADQRPVASNATEDGRAKNRRVELIILPSKAQAASAEWLKTGKAGQKKASGKSTSTDGTAHTEQAPAFNK
jgi:chemotaxis protein MotB